MILDQVSKIKEAVRRKKLAYVRVFDRDNINTFEVLKDLAKFCRAHESTFQRDARAHAVLEGRREVWLRISEFLNLTEEEIVSLHKVKDMKTQER